MVKKSKPRSNPTHPKTYRKRAVLEFVDQDYLASLNNEEREWLSKFNREMYNGEVKGTPLHSREQLLEIQRGLNHLNPKRPDADAYSASRVLNQLVQPDHHEPGREQDDPDNVPSWEEISKE